MLKPGVGAGVFLTLKLSLIGLLCTLCALLTFVTDPDIRMHLKIFLCLAVVLTAIVIWFIGELQKQPPPEEEDRKEKKAQ